MWHKKLLNVLLSGYRLLLLNSSVQRNAERVTAEEVRYMAQELETALGGVYSIPVPRVPTSIGEAITGSFGVDGKMPKMPKTQLNHKL